MTDRFAVWRRRRLGRRPSLRQGLELGAGLRIRTSTWSLSVRSKLRIFVPPSAWLLTDLPRRTTCKAMLKLTRTFIVTSIAKSSDRTQGRPGRKNHATAAATFENSELSAELELKRNVGALAQLYQFAAKSE